MQPGGSPTRIVVRAGIVIMLAVGGVVLSLANAVRVARIEARQWREERSAAKIVGKTADEVVATFGTPYAAERGPDGEPALIVYKQVKHGQYCGIAIKGGMAADVSCSFQ